MKLQKLSDKMLTLATTLTLIRLFLVPYVIRAIMIKRWGLASILFVSAAFTDMFDGFLARLLDEQSTFGAYLDPIADKCLIISCYLALALHESGALLPWWFVVPIIIKELLLLGGAWYLSFTKKVVIRPTWLGKLAMLLQTVLLSFVLLSLAHASYLYTSGGYLLIGTLLVIGAAFGEYSLVAIRSLIVCPTKN